MTGSAPCPASSDSPRTCATTLSALRLAEIEASRRGAGLSQDRLAAVAEISGHWYRILQRLPERATPGVLDRLERALAAQAKGASQRADEQRLIRATYDAHLAFLCARRGQPVRATREALQAGSAADRRERERIRQAARYLANTHLGLTQSALARALGLSKVAVHLALKTIEDLRDDPAWDRLLAEAEGSIGERG